MNDDVLCIYYKNLSKRRLDYTKEASRIQGVPPEESMTMQLFKVSASLSKPLF